MHLPAKVARTNEIVEYHKFGRSIFYLGVPMYLSRCCKVLYEREIPSYIYEKSTITKFKYVEQPRTQVSFQKEGLGKANKEVHRNS